MCVQVTDASIIEISNSLTNLTSLRLSRCQRVSDQGVIALGKLRRLQLLHLNKIHLLTDRAVRSPPPSSSHCRPLWEIC